MLPNDQPPLPFSEPEFSNLHFKSQDPQPIHLNKSLYLKGLRCEKLLWLQKHEPDQADPINQTSKMLMKQSQDVEKRARELFPAGPFIPYENPLSQKISKTCRMIQKQEPIIFDATFQYQGITVKTDVLKWSPQGWELYEIKSSGYKKAIYYKEIALQLYVLKNLGVSISQTFLVTINNQYVRGWSLKPDSLFQISNCTDSTFGRIEEIDSHITKMRLIINGPNPPVPIGPQCINPFDCVFKSFCWEPVPEYSILNLAQLASVERFERYHLGETTIQDLPDNFEPNHFQSIQIQSDRTGEPFIDKEKLTAWLNTLHYPLYFLDFECYQYAIPPFRGLKPFQQIPFQFSLHYRTSTLR